MVLHGIALYDLVSYIIHFACFCIFRFVARAVSRKTPILLIIYIFFTKREMATVMIIPICDDNERELKDLCRVISTGQISSSGFFRTFGLAH